MTKQERFANSRTTSCFEMPISWQETWMQPHAQSNLEQRKYRNGAEFNWQTGTRDETYNLVSILYHALQGAETYDQYISDAEGRGDQDLAQFIRDTKEEDQRRADRAKQLLAQCLT